MLVLDGLRFAKDGLIEVPPFHTGHLGFLPKTQVSVHLLRRSTRGSHCEIAVTPFTEQPSGLFRLACTLRDEPGAVNRVIEAAWRYQINIVKQESSSMNYQQHHVVQMILDWHTSVFKDPIETPERLINRYSLLHHRVPLRDARYIRFYETLMATCGDIIEFDRTQNVLLPSISLLPFASEEPGLHERISVESSRQKLWIDLKLPDAHRAQVEYLAGHSDDDPMPYILRSDTRQRTLHILVPNAPSVEHLIHIALRHNDIPGALEAITSVLKNSEFNIVTSLVRRNDHVASTFEVLIENLKRDDPPPSFGLPNSNGTTYDEVLKWCADRIVKSKPSELWRLPQYGVKLVPPQYPKVKSSVGEIPLRPSKSNKSAQVIPKFDPELNRQELIKEIAGRLENHKDNRSGGGHTAVDIARTDFLYSIQQRLEQKVPTIFLSSPTAASGHAKYLKDALQKNNEFEVLDYVSPSYEQIVEGVRTRIQAADFFLGIWHHEEVMGERGFSFGVSPWMPFEYGVAVSARKECIVIHSDRLPEGIWKRIDPGTSRESYNDVSFFERTVPDILKICKNKWKKKWKSQWFD